MPIMSEPEVYALVAVCKASELSYTEQIKAGIALEYFHRWTMKLEGILHVRIKDIEDAEREGRIDDRITLSENL